jgi:hypothetical protein
MACRLSVLVTLGKGGVCEERRELSEPETMANIHTAMVFFIRRFSDAEADRKRLFIDNSRFLPPLHGPPSFVPAMSHAYSAQFLGMLTQATRAFSAFARPGDGRCGVCG